MIPALVLTAGLATRLRPLSFVRAKAALPVAGEPLARRILRTLRAGGVTEAVLNLHHLPHTLTRHIGEGADLGMRVRYSWEVPVLGSAGGPKRALPLLGARTFLIVNGDTLTDASIEDVVADHARSGALVTLAVIPNTEPNKYGGVLVDDTGAVTGFVRRGSAQSSHHFIGVQVAEADAFTTLPDNTPYESFSRLYPTLMQARPGAIRAHACEAVFYDIGTPADYLATSLALSAREQQRPPAYPGAQIEDSILWDDVAVGAGATLRRCIATDGVRIPDKTSWTDVTIRPAEGELLPTERRVGDLAIADL
jgi:mannose-1-phosphate guanylyltransferase